MLVDAAGKPRSNFVERRAALHMPFHFFLWTVESIEHIAEHGVSQEEFEEVVMNPEGETVSRSTGNPIAF
jgi:hypothetical protein